MKLHILAELKTSQVAVANEVSNRIAAATSTWMSLHIYWKQAHCTAGNKINMFDAVVKSRLLYGLQTLEIPDAQMSRLESVHFKGLRQILRMEPTFVNRAITNTEVLRRANLAIRARNNPNSAVCRIRDTLIKQRIALTGHILRQDHSHPLRNVSFRPNLPFLLKSCFVEWVGPEQSCLILRSTLFGIFYAQILTFPNPMNS